MKRTYIKFEEVVRKLHDGWQIYTSRGSAPYKPLYYHIEKDGEIRNIHPMTIEKLIKDHIINGRDADHGKYELQSAKQNTER
ncbi:MAG: hypothetical protein ABJH04_07755 [Cyclobacteriaceae bacterium]